MAEANARSLGEVKTANLWVEPEPQPTAKEADAQKLAAIAASIEASTDKEESAALSKIANQVKTEGEIDHDIQSMVAKEQPKFSHEQVHSEYMALREGKFDSLFQAEPEE